MTIEKGFVSQTAFKKHLDGDWRTVHELWSHIRNYMNSYPAPAATTYTKTEVDAFFEGYSGGKAQVDAGNVVGLTQGSIPFADASGFLTEDNSNLFWDGGNARLALGHTGPDTLFHLLTATSSEIRIETSGQADPQLSFKSTFTDGNGDIAHQINMFLDQDSDDDTLHIDGQTASVDTRVVMHAQDGERARIILYSGNANYGYLHYGASDDLVLANAISNQNLILGINDGGVAKTITWNASDDKLQHSHGTFNFDDDNILTTGTLTAGVAVLDGIRISLETTSNYIISDVVPPNLSGATNNLLIGINTGDALTSGDKNVLIGEDAGTAMTSASYDVIIGYQAGISNVTSHYNVFIGYRAGYKTTADRVTAVGFMAGGGNAASGSPSWSTYFGCGAGQNSTSSANSTLVGCYAGDQINTGDGNTCVGYYAGHGITSALRNVCIGASSGNAMNSNDNVAIGYRSAWKQTTGAGNFCVGYMAGAYNVTGEYNVYLGGNAGVGALNQSNSWNTGVGNGSMFAITTGRENSCFGRSSGFGITTGDDNVIIGFSAGYSIAAGNANVFIGYKAAYNETGSNKLYIANSDTASPLIYGEFDNDYLLINGRLAVALSTIGDDERGLSSIHTLSANPAKSDGIGFYSEGHIGAITTDGPTYGAGIWLNIDAGATLGADVRALDIGIYEAGATCSGRNAYGLAIHMEFDDTNPPAAIYAFRINCNDTPGHATPDALIFAPNRSAIALTDAAPGTADAYLKVVLQDGSVYRIPLVKE